MIHNDEVFSKPHSGADSAAWLSNQPGNGLDHRARKLRNFRGKVWIRGEECRSARHKIDPGPAIR